MALDDRQISSEIDSLSVYHVAFSRRIIPRIITNNNDKYKYLANRTLQ